MSIRRAAALVAVLMTAVGCGAADGDTPSDSASPPEPGACRMLEPADLAEPTNDTATVDCAAPHTAETFVVSTFSGEVSSGDPDDRKLAAFAHDVCQEPFLDFLGGDESVVKRSMLTWVWFRPSDDGWHQGARWLRCDVIGGGEQSRSFVRLPETARDLLAGRPDDRWMTCADGPSVDGSVRVPCTEPHDWRAISTVVLGESGDPYPGDRAVEARSREFCSDQVAAYLSYPVADYDFGFTWFGAGQWDAGNRRSVCWAKTDQ